jgi:hypothetical protein
VTAALVVGMVTIDGGARLVYLVLHPKEAQALEDAVNAERDASTAPAVPTLAPSVPPATPAPPAPAPPAAPGGP